MKIGILGSGRMGGKIGTILADAGNEVVFSYSRDPKKLDRLAREAGPRACAGSPAQAVNGADAVVLAVNWSQIDDVLGQAGDLSGQVVISCSLPLNDANTELLIAHRASGAEELARRLPSARVVCAFNTIPSELLFDAYHGRVPGGPPGVIYCGDDASAKDVAVELIRAMGFEPIDAGPLRIARSTEPFATLIAQLAYAMMPSPALWYRFGCVQENKA